MEKYIKDGKVGVLVSYGFGAGWSTWNTIDIALDKKVIEKFLEIKDMDNYEEAKFEMEKYMESIGYEEVYLGGLDGLTLEMVDEGSAIKINEYDGSESLEIGYTEFTMI